MGRPKVDTKAVTLRLHEDMIARLEEMAEQYQFLIGVPVTLQDMIRLILRQNITTEIVKIEGET